MIITLKERKSSMYLSDINVGDCFMYENDVYLRISDSESRRNVFNFKCSCTDILSNDTIVEPLNMELVERG